MPKTEIETQTLPLEREDRRVVEILVLVLDARGAIHVESKLMTAEFYRQASALELTATFIAPMVTAVKAKSGA